MDVKRTAESDAEQEWGGRLQAHVAAFEALSRQQHQEILGRLDRHTGMLQAMTGASLGASLGASMSASFGGSPTLCNPVGATESSLSAGSAEDSPRARPITYTSFDEQLKEGTMTMEADNSRRRYASVRKATGVQAPNAKPDKCRCCASFIRQMVQHPFFDSFFGLVVVTNAAFIGIDLQMSLSTGEPRGPTLQAIQYSYTACFTVELILRMVADGKDFFWTEDWMWSALDIFIVLTSLWEVVVDVVQAVADGEGGVQAIAGVSSLKAFRIIRITRVVRTVRLIRLFRFVLALRTLITSIFSTLKSLFWALILLALIVYVFAVLFAQAVDERVRDPAAPDLTEREMLTSRRYYSSLANTMLSLFMSIAGGVSWEEVLAPLRAISDIWVGLFLFYISFTYFAVLNVVTAVFCQSAIDSAQSDHTMVVQSILDDKEAHLEKIRTLFTKFGADVSGGVTFAMFEEKLNTPAVREYFETLGLSVWDAWSFFKLLDADGGGLVEIEEFLMGCLRLRGQATAIDVGRILQDQTWLICNQDRFHQYVELQLQELKGILVLQTGPNSESFAGSLTEARQLDI